MFQQIMVLLDGSIRTATRVLPSEPEKKSCSVEVKEVHLYETHSTTHYDSTARAARLRLARHGAAAAYQERGRRRLPIHRR